MEKKAAFIILKKIKYMEADLILHALSSDGEKKSFLARSALRSKKRFGGGILEPSHQVLMTYMDSKAEGGLNSLKEAQLLNDFSKIRRNYDTLEFGLKILECAEKVSQEGDVDSKYLYNLVGHTLKALEATENLVLLKIQFYLKFFLQQGVLTAEPWMASYLKNPIQEHQLLANEIKSSPQEFQKRCDSLESKIRQYLETAAMS